MKNTKAVHTHGVRPPAKRKSAMPVTEAWVRIRITGICGLVIDNAHSDLVIVIPDARDSRFSVTEPTSAIPAHNAFLMYPKAAASGREADFYVGNGELGVCLLAREMLSLEGGTIVPLASERSDEIVDMATVCAHGAIDPAFVAFPPAPGVLAQVHVPSNGMATHVASDDDYTFQPTCRAVPSPYSGRLAEVIAVDLRIDDASTLILHSHPFSGSAAAEDVVLSLQGTSAAAPLEVTIGNVPLPDLQRFVGDAEGGHKHDRDIHFELYYTLAAEPPALPTIPVRRAKVPHAGNCPCVILPTAR
jgi:hypothetical protein